MDFTRVTQSFSVIKPHIMAQLWHYQSFLKMHQQSKNFVFTEAEVEKEKKCLKSDLDEVAFCYSRFDFKSACEPIPFPSTPKKCLRPHEGRT